jgi:tRNA (adenine37-N6)-methyltransferase
MDIKIKPIAFVTNSRTQAIDDNWAEIISEIELADDIQTEAFSSITDFSHLEIIFYFDKAKQEHIVYAGKPRGNPAYLLVGIFSQRKKTDQIHLGCVWGNLFHTKKERLF